MLRVSSNIDASNCGERRVSRLLAGDISPGSLLLFNGESGSGKSVFCQQLAFNALYSGRSSVAYFTSAGGSGDLLDQMESFAFHIQYHYVSDKLRVYELDPVNDNPSIEDSVRLLLRCLVDLPASFTLAVIDDINPLLAGMDAAAQVMLLRDIRLVCVQKQRSVIVVTSPYAFSGTALTRTFSLCDYFLKTEIVPMPQGLQEMESNLARELEVLKLGGVEMEAGHPVRFEIRAGTGIHILPFMTARA